MNKHIKRFLVTTMTLFALLGLGGTVAYASGYITWGGTEDYQQTLINLDLITDSVDNLQTDKQNLITERDNLITEYEQLIAEHEETGRENEQLSNHIIDLGNEIVSLEQQIEHLENRNNNNGRFKRKVEQAEKDMRHVEERSSEVLEGLDE